jgi:hypothetical protein
MFPKAVAYIHVSDSRFAVRRTPVVASLPNADPSTWIGTTFLVRSNVVFKSHDCALEAARIGHFQNGVKADFFRFFRIRMELPPFRG